MTRFETLATHFANGGTWTCASGKHTISSLKDVQVNEGNRVRCRPCHNIGQQKRNKDSSYNRRFSNGIVPYEPPKVCDLCGQGSRNMQRDHNHRTNKFRGWLCAHCNITLGKIDKVGVNAIIFYLARGV